MLRARHMGQGRTRSACKYGSHELALPREHPMADRVHPAVNAVQPPSGDTVSDRAAAPPQLIELTQGHEPVLAPCECRQRGIPTGFRRFRPVFRRNRRHPPSLHERVLQRGSFRDNSVTGR